MSKCEWCGRLVDELHIHTDAIGDNHSICNNCLQDVEDCVCRKCGNPVDPSLMINGLCTTCIQADMKIKSKRREEVRMGVDVGMYDCITSDVEFTEDEYERWLTMGKTFSPEDMSIKELRNLWIMVKLNAAGIYDREVVAKNFSNIEALLDRNFSKLIHNKCRIVIGNTADTRRIVRSSRVIDYENEVYILAV